LASLPPSPHPPLEISLINSAPILGSNTATGLNVTRPGVAGAACQQLRLGVCKGEWGRGMRWGLDGGRAGPPPPPVCFSIQGSARGLPWDRHIWLPLAGSVPPLPGATSSGVQLKEIRLNPFLPSAPPPALSLFSSAFPHAFQRGKRLKGKEE
jgi:hypothetical protein